MNAAISMWAGWEPTWTPFIEGDDDCALLLPVGASGDDGYAGGSAAIGGVSLFLECAVEVRVSGVPSTIYVDCVAGGEAASKLERALVGG